MARTKKIQIDEAPGEQNVEQVQDLTVGQMLARTRQKRRREIKRIADQLCIRASYLEALENNQYDVFPGQVYAIGFLRTYATFLGLDPEELVDRYKKESEFVQPKPVVMPVPERSAMVPSIPYVLLGLFLIALVWGVWYFASYEPVEKTVALPPIAEADPVDVPVVPVMEQKTEPVATPVEAVKPQPAISKTRIQIVATQDVWLEIQDEDMFIFNRVLKSGETFNVPNDSDEMMLKTGNAGGMDIYVDGQKIKPLGPSGAVRSRIKLSVDALKNR